jgi:high-affinity iron transporter
MMLSRLLLAFALAAPLAAAAQSPQTVMRLLERVGAGYPEAVEGGRIKNEDEYKKMLEITAQVSKLMKYVAEEESLVMAAIPAQAEALAQLVRDKAPAAAIAEALGQLRSQCAGCHGAEGKGDGPAGARLEPAPSRHLAGRNARAPRAKGLAQARAP